MAWRTPNGIVIGYGAVGRLHAAVLDDRCEHLILVDADDDARVRAEADHPGATVLRSLDEVGELDATIGVVATWGPTHPEVYRALVERGCRNVLCEKPLADSVARATDMVDHAESLGVALGVNYVRRHGREAEGIHELADRLALGPALAMVVSGGARGIVTNGIHFVELACDVFDSGPSAAISTARSEPLNPRSPDLGFYGGTAVWTFPGHRELVMSYPLTSSLREDTSIVFRDAVLTITNQLEARVRARPAGEVAAHPAITWSGHPTDELFVGPLPGATAGPGRIATALEIVERGVPGELRMGEHVRALDACIGALESGEARAAVDLPIVADSDRGRRRWPIS